MSIFQRDLTTLAFVTLLMVVCGGGIARLLWLIEGRPHLDRPTWWPRPTTGEHAAQPASAAVGETSNRSRAAVACAACCGVPVLLVAGVLGASAVATFSIVGGALLAVALVAWVAKTGRASQWRRMLARVDRTP